MLLGVVEPRLKIRTAALVLGLFVPLQIFSSWPALHRHGNEIGHLSRGRAQEAVVSVVQTESGSPHGCPACVAALVSVCIPPAIAVVRPVAHSAIPVCGEEHVRPAFAVGTSRGRAPPVA
jgi:hypothetical protein